jgi:hypothetical protein
LEDLSYVLELYIHIHIYIYVCMYVCMYVCLYIYIKVFVYLYIHRRALADTCVGEERNEMACRIRNFRVNRANELYGGRNLCTRKRGRTRASWGIPEYPEARTQVKFTFGGFASRCKQSWRYIHFVIARALNLLRKSSISRRWSYVENSIVIAEFAASPHISSLQAPDRSGIEERMTVKERMFRSLNSSASFARNRNNFFRRATCAENAQDCHKTGSPESCRSSDFFLTGSVTT